VKLTEVLDETDGGSQVRQDAIYKKDDPGHATGETVGIPRRKTVGVPKRETADIPKREMVGAPRRETVGTPRRMMVRAEKTWRRFDSHD
jgi:hypothetical protein